jgi:PPOX class probable F420-dependent enzyme
MATETELWDLIASRREGVLAAIGRNGLPQLTNVLYLPGRGGRTARISTTADRLKARILARDPRAVLHVTGDNFWAYAVAQGHATLTPAAAEPGDEACRELLEVHSAFYGPPDEDAFFAEMIARRRLVIRLGLDRVYGVITSAGRRPLPAPGSAPRLPGHPLVPLSPSSGRRECARGSPRSREWHSCGRSGFIVRGLRAGTAR